MLEELHLHLQIFLILPFLHIVDDTSYIALYLFHVLYLYHQRLLLPLRPPLHRHPLHRPFLYPLFHHGPYNEYH